MQDSGHIVGSKYLIKMQSIFCTLGFGFLMLLSDICASFPRSNQLWGYVVPKLLRLNLLFYVLTDIINTFLLRAPLLHFGGKSLRGDGSFRHFILAWNQCLWQWDTLSLGPRPRHCANRYFQQFTGKEGCVCIIQLPIGISKSIMSKVMPHG